MMDDLASAGVAARFHVYVLSDTSRSDHGDCRGRSVRCTSRRHGRTALPLPIAGARTNTGFKAGNIRDFLARWGDAHDFMVTLDADSFMPAIGHPAHGAASPRRDPRLGILQSLVDRHAVDQRLRPPLPVWHAARHALVDASAALGGRPIAAPTGATTP